MHLTQSLRTDDSNKTRWFSQHNTKATHTFYSFQCFLSLKSWQLIITFRFSVCLSLHQTSIFTSVYSTLFTTVELKNSSFHALTKIFFFRHQTQCLSTFFSTSSLILLYYLVLSISFSLIRWRIVEMLWVSISKSFRHVDTASYFFLQLLMLHNFYS